MGMVTARLSTTEATLHIIPRSILSYLLRNMPSPRMTASMIMSAPTTICVCVGDTVHMLVGIMGDEMDDKE
jgi:hypothetical protein